MKSSAVFHVKHEIDPAKEIFDAVGDISGFHVGPARVLLALYERPEKIGSIIRPDKTKEEDEWQCKACLVLKLGANAFADDEANDFGGFKANVGDWVMVRMNDGRRVDVCGPGGNGQKCFIIKDVHIAMVVPEPWMIW